MGKGVRVPPQCPGLHTASPSDAPFWECSMGGPLCMSLVQREDAPARDTDFTEATQLRIVCPLHLETHWLVSDTRICMHARAHTHFSQTWLKICSCSRKITGLTVPPGTGSGARQGWFPVLSNSPISLAGPDASTALAEGTSTQRAGQQGDADRPVNTAEETAGLEARTSRCSLWSVLPGCLHCASDDGFRGALA